MATVLVQQQSIRHSATPPPISPALSLNVRPRTPTSIPNKHIPVCPPGSAPSAISPVEQTGISLTSLLYPPDRFNKISHSPPVYSIDGATLVAALDHLATQPLPDPKQVFPWLHGLHPFNGVQSAFFCQSETITSAHSEMLSFFDLGQLGWRFDKVSTARRGVS